MTIINMKEFEPLSSHQVGIKIKNIIKDHLNKSDEIIILNFENIDVCTDSFAQQITTILAEDVPFKLWKERVKFKNLNNFLLDLIKGKLHNASKIS